MSNTDKKGRIGYDDVTKIAKSTQEQAVASWINQLNQIRIDECISRLTGQKGNLKAALSELKELKTFIDKPEHILGNSETKHGEIAEHVQVNISNARKIVEGLKGEYTFEGVGKTAPEDYLHNGLQVQLKFIGGRFGNQSFYHITEHLKKYPDFISNGGTYDIPKDQYDNIIRYLHMSPEDIKAIPSTSEDGGRSIRKLVENIKDWEIQNNVKFEDKVKPAIVDYNDVQKSNIGNTIKEEEKAISKKDLERRDEAHLQSKPTLQEGVKATATAAIVEGGMVFCLGVAGKMKEGKKIPNFTSEDWQELGIKSGRGAGKGAIRGASVYTLTNFTASPAAVASAFVSASFGVVSQSQLLRGGIISQEDFIINSEAMCLEASISAMASIAGQVLIPIPVLGTVIGNATGMFMYGIAKNYLSERELRCIEDYNSEISIVKENLNAELQATITEVESEFTKFANITDLAFDEDVNIAFNSSIALAYASGVDEELILQDKSAVDDFFQ